MGDDDVLLDSDGVEQGSELGGDAGLAMVAGALVRAPLTRAMLTKSSYMAIPSVKTANHG